MQPRSHFCSRDIATAKTTSRNPVTSVFAMSGRYDVVCRDPDIVRQSPVAVLNKRTGGLLRFKSEADALLAMTLLDRAFPGREIWRATADNLIVNTGINSILDNGVSSQTWYLGLKGVGAVVAGDTAAQIGGTNAWGEIVVYSQGTRPAWGEGAAASQQVTNATAVTYSINGSATVAGIFGISDSTKGGTTGTLLSAADFAGGNQAVSNGNQLDVTYTITGTSS